MNFKKVKGKIFTSLLAPATFLFAVGLFVVSNLTNLVKLVSWFYIAIGW
jgi:hypothetical protein